MKEIIKLRICLIGNASLLIIVIVLFATLGSGGPFWRFGPHPDLILISVKIDTWGAYAVVLILTGLVRSFTVFVNELGMPVLGFSIYNPDKKHVEQFTKNELQFYGNSMFMVNAIRVVFMTMVNITQIDLALWGVLIGEFASFFAIRLLLNEKTFGSSITSNKAHEHDIELFSGIHYNELNELKEIEKIEKIDNKLEEIENLV